MADVQNCLTGAEGATFIFGPQKGVSSAQLESFDAGITRFAACLETALAREASLAPGSGAAGGLGFAVRMLGGELRSGAAMIADLLGLDSLLSKADWALTGEGSTDRQTLRGKAPHIVSERGATTGHLCHSSIGSGRRTGPIHLE
jgi:glycerate kinase